MRDSRLGIVLVLVAAEVFLVGVMMRSIGFSNPSVHAAGFHHVSYTPKTFSPIDAGATPHVVIADAQSRVIVGLSQDNMVHVADATSGGGALWASQTPAQLLVNKTGDGVRVERPGDLVSHGIFAFGWYSPRIEVDVPAQARVEILRSGGAEISDLQGPVVAHSVDGHISVSRTHGTLDLSSDDGYLSLTDVVSSSVKLATKDGSLRFSGVDAGALDARTDDGPVRASDLHVGSGSIETSDGSVRIGLRNPDLTVSAKTDDGRIRVDGVTQPHTDSDASTGQIRLGNGTGSLSVASHDGSISITTNGAQQ